MGYIIDFVEHHHEPVQREIKLLAAAGLVMLVMILCAAAYVRIAGENQTSGLPAAWVERPDAYPLKA